MTGRHPPPLVLGRPEGVVGSSGRTLLHLRAEHVLMREAAKMNQRDENAKLFASPVVVDSPRRESFSQPMARLDIMEMNYGGSDGNYANPLS